MASVLSTKSVEDGAHRTGLSVFRVFSNTFKILGHPELILSLVRPHNDNKSCGDGPPVWLSGYPFYRAIGHICTGDEMNTRLADQRGSGYRLEAGCDSSYGRGLEWEWLK